jgi:hypothetical protein
MKGSGRTLFLFSICVYPCSSVVACPALLTAGELKPQMNTDEHREEACKDPDGLFFFFQSVFICVHLWLLLLTQFWTCPFLGFPLLGGAAGGAGAVWINRTRGKTGREQSPHYRLGIDP